jgi:hypothetical protein
MRLIALQNDVPPNVAAHAIDRLLNTSRTVEPIAETFRAEYRGVPTIVNMVFNPADRTPLGFDQDDKTIANEHRLRLNIQKLGWLVGSTHEEVTADLAHVYKRLVKTVSEPYQAQELQLLEDRVPLTRPHDWLLTRDPVGAMLADHTVPVFVPIITRYYRRATELNATEVVIALRQYEQAEHHAPATLSEIVPKYLSQIPDDPFDTKPLRYRVRPDGKWIVYSVGPDQIDNGGEQLKIDPRRPGDKGDVIFCECEPAVELGRLQRPSH